MIQVKAIDIKGLNKSYSTIKGHRAVHALKHFNLSIDEGEIFAILGPNGAGKSTAIGIIVGTILKNSGHVKVFGHDVVDDYKITRKMIGVVPQEVNFDPFINVRKVLDYQSGMFGVPKKERWVDEILKRLQLSEHAFKTSRALSGGMKRRLLIAKALVHKPKILILDEPTAGVDVELRHDLWEFVKELNRAGTTIILTTHYLEEAEKLANRVAILHKGEIRDINTVPRLKEKYDAATLEEVYMHLVHDKAIKE